MVDRSFVLTEGRAWAHLGVTRYNGSNSFYRTQHICNIAWAYSKNGYRPEELFITFRTEAIQRMATMEPLNVSNLAWAFASCGRSDERTCKRNGFRDMDFAMGLFRVATRPMLCVTFEWGHTTSPSGRSGNFCDG